MSEHKINIRIEGVFTDVTDEEQVKRISDEINNRLARVGKRRVVPQTDMPLYYGVEPKPKRSLWQKFLGLFSRHK